MPALLPNTTTTDDYNDCAMGGDRGYAYGSITIANNPVSILLEHGQRGSAGQTEYEYVTPSTLPLVGIVGRDEIVGVKIKSAIPGGADVAQVSGWLIEPNVAGIQPGSAYTSTISAGGGVTPPGAGGSVPQVGDYKVSAQAASHAEPAGGTWYLCDGTALPAAEVALIALIGASTFDARGRNLTMLGTHADVNAKGDNEGAALANRSQSHHHLYLTNSEPSMQAGGVSVVRNPGSTKTTGNANLQDTPAFIVPGSLFVYGSGS